GGAAGLLLAGAGCDGGAAGAYLHLIVKVTVCGFGASLSSTGTGTPSGALRMSRLISMLRFVNRPEENSRLRPNCVTASSFGQSPLMVRSLPFCSMVESRKF